MDRNLALEFVRITEASAIEAAKMMGRGDKILADQFATDAMRARMRAVEFSGTIIIGEGEKDEAPGLFHGEKVGCGGPEMDVAVDPLEGTTSLAQGKQNSLSVMASSPKGTMMMVPGTYMDQIATGPEAAHAIDLNASAEENIRAIARELKKDVEEVTVVILDRPRLQPLIDEIRKAGARIKLIDHGTVSATIAAALPERGIDVLMGDGGAPETIIAACALKCLGGNMFARLKPHNEIFAERARKMGITDFSRVYSLNELVRSQECAFAATGITDGPLLRGVTFQHEKIRTHSLVMIGKSRTIRYMDTYHHYQR